MWYNIHYMSFYIVLNLTHNFVSDISEQKHDKNDERRKDI